jgi:threonine aldolase
LENSHNRCVGAAIPPDYMARVREIADRHRLKVHLDGARVFNAAVALGVDVREIAQYVDSVTFCLSKGLCAPVGSVLCGDEDFIYRAHRARKVLGGGMRQAGFLAAAGIVALESMVDRLAEDHARARRLAEGISSLDEYAVDLDRVQTNIIYFDLAEGVSLSLPEVSARLREQGVLINAYPGMGLRAVTHYWVDDEAVEVALVALKRVFGSEAL